MSNIRFARGPLNLALILGLIGAVSVFAPWFVPGLPFEEYSSLGGYVFGGLALVLLVLSAIAGSRQTDDDEEDEITDDDLVPTVAFGPGAYGDDLADVPPPLTKADKKALKEDERRAKKEAAARAKFEKEAQKQAAKAAKASRKRGAADPDNDDWVESIREESTPEDEQAFPTSFANPYAGSTYEAPATPAPADDLAFAPAPPSRPMPFGQGTPAGLGEEPAEPGTATDVPLYGNGEYQAPAWAEAAADDPAFTPPFAADAYSYLTDETPAEGDLDGNADDGLNGLDGYAATDAASEDLTTDLDGDAASDAATDELAGDALASDLDGEDLATDLDSDAATGELAGDADGYAGDELGLVEDALASIADALEAAAASEEDDEDSEITPDDPEYRVAQLAMQMEEILAEAHVEVRAMKDAHRADRRKRERDIARLGQALTEARSEVGRLADALSDRAASDFAEMNARSALAQAELEAAQARMIRDQVRSRLRQVRLAVIGSEDPDREILEIIDQSLAAVGEEPEVGLIAQPDPLAGIPDASPESNPFSEPMADPDPLAGIPDASPEGNPDAGYALPRP